MTEETRGDAQPDARIRTGLSAGAIVTVVIGGIVFMLALVGMLMPE